MIRGKRIKPEQNDVNVRRMNPPRTAQGKCHYEFDFPGLSSLDSLDPCSDPLPDFQDFEDVSFDKDCKLNENSDSESTDELDDDDISTETQKTESQSKIQTASSVPSANDQDPVDNKEKICAPLDDDDDDDEEKDDEDDTLQRLKTSQTKPTKTASNAKETFSTNKNYCYVCKKPQSKFARHLKRHQKSEPEIAAVFLLPKHSKDRKRLLEKLRNRGNYEHNQEVINNNSGQLKVRRRPVRSEIKLSAKTYVHCVYCKGLFARKDLWRHTKRCPSKPVPESKTTRRAQVLVLADIESTFSRAISPEVWKILSKMKNDEASSVVRSDFYILQISQCLYNKHRSDPKKFEFIRKKVRDVARLLLNLRNKYAISTFEDCLKPNNFHKVVCAVKDIAGYEEKSQSYKMPRLALKLGKSLVKIAEFILCRAIVTEEGALVLSAERFKRLCLNEWTEDICHPSRASSKKTAFDKPSTVSLTRDVRLLHRYLEKKSTHALEKLKNHESSQTYTELAKITLARVVIFNRHRGRDVSKITLESFNNRTQSEDVDLCFCPFKRNISKRFSKVELMERNGGNVSVLLNPELVDVIQLLVDKRDRCEVDVNNPFVFGRPSSFSFFKVQDCIRIFAVQCGAKYPEYLYSVQLQKLVSTVSQILHLENDELKQLANVLGLVGQFNKFSLSDVELAKISKMLLLTEKESLTGFQEISTHDVEIEAELDVELNEDESSPDDEDYEESDPVVKVTEKRKMSSAETENLTGFFTEKRKMSPDETESFTDFFTEKRNVSPDETGSFTEVKTRKNVKRPWSSDEVSAVMKHFNHHISTGSLATKAECDRCKRAEAFVLRERTVQNIRDFVRNRGLMFKRQRTWQDPCYNPYYMG